MTFEPDHLTVPDTPPLPLGEYAIYYTPPEASGIVERAVSLMGVSSVSTQAFASEQQMVTNLTGLDHGFFPGCFVHGAGEISDTSLIRKINLIQINCGNFVYAGVVFTNLGSNVEYTIRLRHEVGSQNSWFTNTLGPTFELPGSRVSK